MSALGKPAIAVSPSSICCPSAMYLRWVVRPTPRTDSASPVAHDKEEEDHRAGKARGRRGVRGLLQTVPRPAAQVGISHRQRIEIGRVFSIRLGTITDANVAPSWWARGRLSAG